MPTFIPPCLDDAKGLGHFEHADVGSDEPVVLVVGHDGGQPFGQPQILEPESDRCVAHLRQSVGREFVLGVPPAARSGAPSRPNRWPRAANRRAQAALERYGAATGRPFGFPARRNRTVRGSRPSSPVMTMASLGLVQPTKISSPGATASGVSAPSPSTTPRRCDRPADRFPAGQPGSRPGQ